MRDSQFVLTAVRCAAILACQVAHVLWPLSQPWLARSFSVPSCKHQTRACLESREVKTRLSVPCFSRLLFFLSLFFPAVLCCQVTILALQQIFSRFGKVDKIVMFDKGSGFQALVQMADVYTAMNAHEAADMQVC